MRNESGKARAFCARGIVVAAAVIVASTHEGARVRADEAVERGRRPAYDLIDLGTNDHHEVAADAINDRGDVTGSLLGTGTRQPGVFVKPRGQPMRAVSADTGAWARDIANDGTIAGALPQADGTSSHAVLWTRRGAVIDLHTMLPSGAYSSVALGVNDLLQASGYYLDEVGHGYAFVATPRRAIVLGEGTALDINVWGVSVGQDMTGAALWSRDGVLTKLGTLGGLNSWAAALNDAGAVTGSAALATSPDGSGGSSHAFLWTRAEGMRDLGTLVTGQQSTGYGINLRGDVVGSALVSDYEPHAVVVPRGGTMRDLNDLIDRSTGWLLQYANDVNDAGEIVGYGIHEGRTRAYLLRPRR